MLEPLMLPARSKAELIDSIRKLEDMGRHKKQNKNFSPSAKCSRCPANDVPCSWQGEWLCSSCFDRFAESDIGSSLFQIALGREGIKTYSSNFGDGESHRLKGFKS